LEPVGAGPAAGPRLQPAMVFRGDELAPLGHESHRRPSRPADGLDDGEAEPARTDGPRGVVETRDHVRAATVAGRPPTHDGEERRARHVGGEDRRGGLQAVDAAVLAAAIGFRLKRNPTSGLSFSASTLRLASRKYWVGTSPASASSSSRCSDSYRLGGLALVP